MSRYWRSNERIGSGLNLGIDASRGIDVEGACAPAGYDRGRKVLCLETRYQFAHSRHLRTRRPLALGVVRYVLQMAIVGLHAAVG
jgi:hypothetical protein